jgi:hypothetical protein
MTKRFRKWLASWLRQHRAEPVRFRICKAERIPSNLLLDLVYVIGDEECNWMAALRCPCGCGEPIQLSLVRDARPSWRAECERNGAATLLPSVWRTTGCKSHFIIYKGRLIWCSSDWDNSDTIVVWDNRKC